MGFTVFSLLVLVSIMLAGSQAQRFVPGYCPSPAPQENFDKLKFFGHWVEAEKTPSMFDMVMRCMELDYSDDNDGSINVVVKGVSLAGLPVTVNGDGLVQDVTKHGHYSVRYGFGVPFQGTLTTILDTDYTEYAVVYSCTNSLLSGMFHSEYIWILSKDGLLSNPTRQNIYERLDKLKINRSGLQLSDRNGCPNNSTVQRETEPEGSKPASSSTPSSVPLFDVVPASEASAPVAPVVAGPAVIASAIAEVVPGASVAPVPPAVAASSAPTPLVSSSAPAPLVPSSAVKPVPVVVSAIEENPVPAAIQVPLVEKVIPVTP